MTVFQIDVELFDRTIDCYVLDEFDPSLNMDEEEYKSYGAFIEYRPHDCLDLYVKKDTAIDEIVHECVHLANRLIYDHGVSFTLDDDEIHAYLVGYLFRKVAENLLKTDFSFVING